MGSTFCSIDTVCRFGKSISYGIECNPNKNAKIFTFNILEIKLLRNFYRIIAVWLFIQVSVRFLRCKKKLCTTQRKIKTIIKNVTIC